MRFLLRFGISTLAVLLASYLLPGIYLENFLTAVIVAAVLSFLNAILRPVMVILTIPITIFSFGFFLLIINGIIIAITDKLIQGFAVKNFFVALLFSIMMWMITTILQSLIRKKPATED